MDIDIHSLNFYTLTLKLAPLFDTLLLGNFLCTLILFTKRSGYSSILHTICFKSRSYMKGENQSGLSHQKVCGIAWIKISYPPKKKIWMFLKRILLV